MNSNSSFTVGYLVASVLCTVVFVFILTKTNNDRDQRLIDNGYAHYDAKTAEFIFHEKEKP